MMTSSNGNGFRVNDPWRGESTVRGGFPLEMASNASFAAFFDVSLNKQPTKPFSRQGYETIGCSLWRQRGVY